MLGQGRGIDARGVVLRDVVNRERTEVAQAPAGLARKRSGVLREAGALEMILTGLAEHTARPGRRSRRQR